MNGVINLSLIQRYVIVFGVVFASFTAFRITILGIGELIFLVAGLFALFNMFYQPVDRRYVFSTFWSMYLLVGICGFAYNLFVLNLATGSFKGMFFDTAAYIMVLLACLAMEQLFLNRGKDAYQYLKSLFFFFTILMSTLFVLNFFTSNIGGLSLRYYHHFAPFVVNVHQIAMLIAPFVFIGVLVIEKEKDPKTRLLAMFLTLMTLLMLPATGASKAMLGVLLGAGGYVAAKLQAQQSPQARVATLFIGFSFGMLLLIQGDILVYGVAAFAEADDQGGRAYLYSAGLELVTESWLVGRGNGQHIWYHGKFDDAHQTLLSAMLQTGIIGLFLYLRLLFNIMRKAFDHSPAVFGAICTITIYVLGGDILRRLPIWMLLVILFYTVYQMEVEKKNETRGQLWG